jgi:hypothetical protein
VCFQSVSELGATQTETESFIEKSKTLNSFRYFVLDYRIPIEPAAKAELGARWSSSDPQPTRRE